MANKNNNTASASPAEREDKLIEQAAEYYVNNVRYEVDSSFKNANSGAGSGDLLDKLKHLILTEELNIKGE